MDVDALEGRELDAAVAGMMGCQVEWSKKRNEPLCTCKGRTHEQECSYVPRILARYSAYITAAMVLLRELMESGVIMRFCNGDGDSFDIDIMDGIFVRLNSVHMSVETWEEVPTMISRAYLKAKRIPNAPLD